MKKGEISGYSFGRVLRQIRKFEGKHQQYYGRAEESALNKLAGTDEYDPISSKRSPSDRARRAIRELKAWRSGKIRPVEWDRP